MEKFEKAELEVVSFDTCDVICASDGKCNIDGGGCSCNDIDSSKICSCQARVAFNPDPDCRCVFLGTANDRNRGYIEK